MTAATAGRVRGILGGVRGGIAGGWHRGGFGLSGGATGFCFACSVLHVPFFHERDLARPILREILCTQDVLEFFAQAAVQGRALCCIVPIEIRN
jgi:hypothetical protein